MTHIIRQQYLHVELTGTEAQGLALQRRLPELCHQWLTPALEQALTRCAPPTDHLYLEQVELDLGTVVLAQLEEQLPTLVATALEHAIRAQMPGDRSPATTMEAGSAQQKSAQQSMIDSLLYFLETGSLPWHFRLPATSTLEQLLLASWQETATTEGDINGIRSALMPVLASARVRQRLILHFSPHFLDVLLLRLSPAVYRVIQEIVTRLFNTDLSPGTISTFTQQLWQHGLAAIASGSVLSADQLVSAAWHTLLPTPEATVLGSIVKHHWPNVSGVAATVADQIEATASTAPPATDLSRSVTPETGTMSDAIDNAVDAGKSGGELDDRAAEVHWAEVSVQAVERSEEHPEARAGIYIENAGIVLLHPFLPQFFSLLEIAIDDALVQPERALCLLHFLATGQAAAPEYDLVLPKILCNLPLVTPVNTNLELTEAERAEANALLEAVIGHWEVLRNTSPDGLRGAFLLRPGKVALRDDGDWLLQVEASGVDILLDQLPWGVSIVKLPWMERMLWTEWG